MSVEVMVDGHAVQIDEQNQNILENATVHKDSTGKLRVYVNRGGKSVPVHRLLKNAPNNRWVIFLNENSLDLCIDNLQLLTPEEQRQMRSRIVRDAHKRPRKYRSKATSGKTPASKVAEFAEARSEQFGSREAYVQYLIMQDMDRSKNTVPYSV
jgi:hypothetical protein